MIETPLSISIDEFDRVMLMDDGDCKTYSIGYSKLGKRKFMVVTLTKCFDEAGPLRFTLLPPKIRGTLTPNWPS